jgi:hypothetical protein
VEKAPRLVRCDDAHVGSAIDGKCGRTYAVTPSGATEAYFDMPVARTLDLLANKCIDLGWSVVSLSETIVTCQAPLNFGQSVVANLLIGNRYSTPPKLYYRFNLAGSGPSTHVHASGGLRRRWPSAKYAKNRSTAPRSTIRS